MNKNKNPLQGLKKLKNIKIKIKKERILFLIVFFAMIAISKSLNLVLVNGNSMLPTYKDKSLLMSEKIKNHEEDIQINDCVVFTADGVNEKGNATETILIKRVVGIPGDTLLIKDGSLYRNNKKVDDNFGHIDNPGMLSKEYTLKKDEFFCMGDNRNGSTDSRMNGPVKKDKISNIITGEFLGFIFNQKQ